MKMPPQEEAIKIIEQAGHVLPHDEHGNLKMVEWGDTPCCGPTCTTCGDYWCLWENWLEVDECEGP